MEEKRSCHSLHSVRSTRSFLSRPTSDISFIEDEEKAKMAGKIVNNVAAASNGHYIRGNSVQNSGNQSVSSVVAKSGVTETNQGYASNYLKVEGGAYRVQRSSSSGSCNNAAQSVQTVEGGGGSRPRASIDVGTQSCASSCTQTDESCLAPAPVVLLPAHGSVSPHPGVYMDHDLARSQSAMGPGYTRATSPTPPYAYGQPPPPSSCYHAPATATAYDAATAAGYYHTYLNPLVDTGTGLQYDIIVRRPSIGPVTDLAAADPAAQLRRPSMGAVYPPHLLHHHIQPHSLPGSFDSSLPPPLNPSFTAPGQPLSPRHLHSSNSNILSTSPIAPHAISSHDSLLATSSIDQSKPIPIPSVPANVTTTNTPDNIPKLIHETSI